jgi:hypothetical protein
VSRRRSSQEFAASSRGQRIHELMPYTSPAPANKSDSSKWCRSQSAPADRATAHLNAEPQIGLEHAPVICTRVAAHGGSIRDGADLHTIKAPRLEPRITRSEPTDCGHRDGCTRAPLSPCCHPAGITSSRRNTVAIPTDNARRNDSLIKGESC